MGPSSASAVSALPGRQDKAGRAHRTELGVTVDQDRRKASNNNPPRSRESVPHSSIRFSTKPDFIRSSSLCKMLSLSL